MENLATVSAKTTRANSKKKNGREEATTQHITRGNPVGAARTQQLEESAEKPLNAEASEWDELARDQN
jgi:hypothetical protein